MAQLAHRWASLGKRSDAGAGHVYQKFTDEGELEQAQRGDAPRTAAAVDRKTMAALAQASGPRSGEEEVQLGLALANYEQYQKPAEAAGGIDKGGGKRPDQAVLVLGRLCFKLNKPDESQAAFAKWKSPPLGQMASSARLHESSLRNPDVEVRLHAVAAKNVATA